jgi:hypothetical protein
MVGSTCAPVRLCYSGQRHPGYTGAKIALPSQTPFPTRHKPPGLLRRIYRPRATTTGAIGDARLSRHSGNNRTIALIIMRIHHLVLGMRMPRRVFDSLSGKTASMAACGDVAGGTRTRAIVLRLFVAPLTPRVSPLDMI